MHDPARGFISFSTSKALGASLAERPVMKSWPETSLSGDLKNFCRRPALQPLSRNSRTDARYGRMPVTAGAAAVGWRFAVCLRS